MSTSIEKKRAANKRWSDANPEKQKEAIKKWKQNNKHKLREYDNKRRSTDEYKESAKLKRQTQEAKMSDRNSRYLRNYGISLEEYNQLLEKQHNVCAICHLPEKAKNNQGEIRQLAVDHCHTTGKVRGLLCHSCNVLLGKAYDNVVILANAIEYLKNTKEL